MIGKSTAAFITIVIWLGVSNAWSMQNEVRGVVTDAETSESLPGVNIRVKGTTTGGSTNINGEFSVGVSSLSDTLLFTFIGYQELEIPLEGRSELNVQMNPLTLLGDELVVVGYGTVRQRDLSGSIVQLDESRLNQSVSVSVDEMLRGKAPGMQVVQNSGEPGGGLSINIRGVGSITGGTSPLYVIDGMPIDNTVLITGTGNQVTGNPTPRNPLSALNPSDIQSIEILKDASATAIYGARGANGVIMITTKTGEGSEDLQISYSGSVGVQNTHNRLNLLNAQQYMEGVNALIDAGEGSESDRVTQIHGGGTDWQDVIFRDNALMRNNDISFSWGNRATSYLVSVNNTAQNGLIEGSSYERYGARLNLRHSTDRVNFGINSSMSYIQDDFVPYGTDVNERSGVINAAKFYDPTLPLMDENGRYTLSQHMNIDNPEALIKGHEMDSNRYRYFGTIFAEYFLRENLSAKLNLGGDVANEDRSVYKNRTTVMGRSLGGVATAYNAVQTNYLIEGTLNYTENLDNHRINAVVGVTTQRFMRKTSNMQGNNFVTDATGASNFGLADRSTLTTGSGKSSSQLLSYLGRINYSFLDKYMVTATYRIDGSSRFGEGNRFGYFPSLSVGWSLDQEDFFPFDDLFNMFKIRASWGRTGNQEIGNNQSILTFGNGRTLVLDDEFVTTLNPSRIANPDLKWETTEQINLGIDFSLLQDRISGAVEWYKKDTSDMLISLPVPTSSGFTSRLENVGSMTNSGFELSITSTNVITNSFAWSTDFNFSTLENEVESLGSIDRIISSNNIIEPGLPLRSFYGYEVEGIWQEGDDFSVISNNVQAGDFKFRDVNGDGVINANDRVILGNSFPDFVIGLGNTLSYKSVDFHFFFEGVTGINMLNDYLVETYFPRVNSPRANRLATPFLNRWTPDNPTNEYPSFLNPNSQQGQSINSRTVVDASYLKLQTARITFNVPERLLSNVLRSAQVYVSGQNLWTLSDYDGFDPALNPGGNSFLRVDRNGYPSARTYLVGVNVEF